MCRFLVRSLTNTAPWRLLVIFVLWLSADICRSLSSRKARPTENRSGGASANDLKKRNSKQSQETSRAPNEALQAGESQRVFYGAEESLRGGAKRYLAESQEAAQYGEFGSGGTGKSGVCTCSDEMVIASMMGFDLKMAYRVFERHCKRIIHRRIEPVGGDTSDRAVSVRVGPYTGGVPNCSSGAHGSNTSTPLVILSFDASRRFLVQFVGQP